MMTLHVFYFYYSLKKQVLFGRSNFSLMTVHFNNFQNKFFNIMANPTALISYPRFEDLEKSNITSGQSATNQKTSRKSRSDNKEKLANENPRLKKNECNVDCIVTSNRDISTANLSRTEPKDVEILPILDEKEEKEEVNDCMTVMTVDDSGNVSFYYWK